MCRFLIVAALVVVGSLSGRADADPLTVWSMNAASCTPGLASQSGYTLSGGAVVSTGTLPFFSCPIASNLRQSHGTSNTLLLTYKGNSNYTGCTGFCPAPKWTEASLVAISRSTGMEAIVATINTLTATTVTTQGLRFSYAFDFDANFYYVVLRVHGNGSEPQTAYGVALQDTW